MRSSPPSPTAETFEKREPVWLLMEWRSDDDPTAKFYLTTLPRRMSHKQLVHIIEERWRTERMYEELEGDSVDLQRHDGLRVSDPPSEGLTDAAR